MAYEPRPAPNNVEEMQLYLNEELQLIADSLNLADLTLLAERTNAVEKPRPGMIVFADGANWQPVRNGGKGFYGFYNGSWHKLG